ncbi:MAG: class I SAM-dependent methyltransferase [Undibacterium sp.]
MTIREALKLSSDLPRLDREVLLSQVLRKGRLFLATHDEVALSPSQLKRYRSLLSRAGKNEPIAYIVGEKEFYGRMFHVGKGVLIPRPETELIVEHTMESISKRSQKKISRAVIDVGTGSSAIITSIYLSLSSSQRKKIDWYALEKELAALHYARKNLKRHRIGRSIILRKSDLLARIEKKLTQYDELFIIANLPYLSTSLYRSTAPNVQAFEPESALVSGNDGLTHYRALMETLLRLRKNGKIVHFSFEISPEQHSPVLEWLTPLTEDGSLIILPDLAERDRIVSGTLR